MEQNNNQMIEEKELQEALNGIKQAVQGEREDELFYDYLIGQAPTSEEKEIISSIRDDERRHNQLFRTIYKEVIGNEIPASGEEEFEKPESYLEGIKKALFGELRAVEKYRAIRERLLDEIYRDILFDIITDELKHASKYNYLFTLNSTREPNSSMNENMMRQDETSEVAINEIDASKEDKSKFTPDDWIKYISPLADRAIEEFKEGANPEHLCQQFIAAGILVGLGKKPDEAIEEIEEWEKTGDSKLLTMSRMSRYFD